MNRDRAHSQCASIAGKRRGQFVALGAATGALKWATQGRDGTHASIQQTARHLLFLTDGGVLIVARRTPDSFVEERRSRSPGVPHGRSRSFYQMECWCVRRPESYDYSGSDASRHTKPQ